MKNKASIILILCILALLFLPGQICAEDAGGKDVVQINDIPFPRMYRGSFEQGAVIYDSIKPFSLFTLVWYNGIDSIYFVMEGDTSAFFCWNFREWTLDTIAVEDGFGTFEKTVAEYRESCTDGSFLLDIADEDELGTFKEALTTYWEACCYCQAKIPGIRQTKFPS